MDKLQGVFGKKSKFADVLGLCKASTVKEIESQGWSLNPGRYVGVAPGEPLTDEGFLSQFEALAEELEGLNEQADALREKISRNASALLESL